MTSEAPILAAVDFGDLMKALLIFVFFILPVVRGILTSRKQQEEARRRQRDRAFPDSKEVQEETPAEPATAEGLEAWEALLRGELVPEERSAPIEEAEPPLAPMPYPIVEQEVEQAASSAPARGRVGQAEAERLEGSRLLEHVDVGPEFRGLESTFEPMQFGDPLPTGLPSEREQAGFAVLSGLPTPLALVGDDSLRVQVRAEDWKRAIVLSEILSAPAALRHGPATGPRS